jgi:DNA-binding NarL/FixJ family response regulator
VAVSEQTHLAPAVDPPPGPGGSEAIRVLVVDDHALFRRGLEMVLGQETDIEVVGEAGDGAEALRLLDRTPADVVVMDIRMPVMDGVAATRAICATADGPRVIVLTTFDTDAEAFASLRAGASGFLLKSAAPEDLLSAIRTVAAGDAVVAPRVTRRLLDRYATTFGSQPAPDPCWDTLTDREREVVTLLADGMSNAEIAARLVVTEATVKTHVGRILAKLGLRDRVQIVIHAYQTGLVKP